MDRLVEAFLQSTKEEFNFKQRYSQIVGIPEDKCLTTIKDAKKFATMIAPALLNNTKVTALIFDGIPLWTVKFHRIIRALRKKSLRHIIESLSFSKCMLDTAAALSVAQFICVSTSIIKVDLSFNELSNPVLIKLLAWSLQINGSLKSLDLSGNNLLYSENIEDIIYSPGLDKLWLRGTHLKSDVLEGIFENMEGFSLSELYLDNNERISSRVLLSIADGLIMNNNKKLIALTLPKVCTQHGVPIEDIDADNTEVLAVQNAQLVINEFLRRNRECIKTDESVDVVRRSVLDSVARDAQPVLTLGVMDGECGDLRKRAISEATPMLARSKVVCDADVRDEEESTVAASSCWRDVLNCCKRQLHRR